MPHPHCIQTQAPEVGKRLLAIENPNVDPVARRKSAKARHEAKGQATVTDGNDQIPMG